MSSKRVSPRNKSAIPTHWDDFQEIAIAICRKVGARFTPRLSSQEILGMAWLVWNDHQSKFDADRSSFPTFFSMKLSYAIKKELGQTHSRQHARKDQETDDLLEGLVGAKLQREDI